MKQSSIPFTFMIPLLTVSSIEWSILISSSKILSEKYSSQGGTVDTNTHQKLKLVGSIGLFNGVVAADAWNPDGSGVNVRCQMVHLPNLIYKFEISNSVTNKIIITVRSQEIVPFDVYKIQ